MKTALLVVIRASLAAVLAVAVLATAASADGPAGPTGHAASRCGDLPDSLIYNIRTNRVGCHTGRRVASQWGPQCAQRPGGSCRVTAGFYCSYRNTDYEAGAIRCTRNGGRVVRFVTGS
jgi:hypothetical protein